MYELSATNKRCRVHQTRVVFGVNSPLVSIDKSLVSITLIVSGINTPLSSAAVSAPLVGIALYGVFIFFLLVTLEPRVG